MENKALTATALTSLGNYYYQQKSYSEALKFTKQAATLACQVRSPDTCRPALLLVAWSYIALNQLAPAREALASAIHVVETMRTQVVGSEQEQQRFFADKLPPYFTIINLLATGNEPAEAWAYAERAKARVLLEVLQSGRVNISKAMSRQEQAQERQLND